MRKLPLYYFAPTICWIDDNNLFLEAADRLFGKEYKCLTFDKPKEAFQFLESYQPLSTNINFSRETHERESSETSEIIKLSSMNDLKNEIVILIIDNNMPEMNGLEICHKLKEKHFKKILLTGSTDLPEVIDAFNNGIIDKFIARDQNVSEKLQKNIFELSYQFFYEKTQNLLSHLEFSRSSPLTDPIFIDFFYQWLQSIQYKEFYLLNKNGSFLVKDKNGTTHYFIVMSEFAKDEFIKLNDEGMDQTGELLSQLSRGEMIPFFGVGHEYWEFEYKAWDRFFYPANVIKGREKYYWTIIKE